MRYKFQIEDSRGEPWYEEFDVPPHIEPKVFVEKILTKFNSDLQLHETARKMLSFELVGEPKDHTWEKQNVFTEQRAGSFFDRYKCKKCNITGRRYGIGGSMVLDSKFKAKVYRTCDTSITHQKIREERKKRKERGVL